MKFVETELPGVILIEPKVFEDARGYFMETWRESLYRDAGIDARFVQENVSRSLHRNTLRGLHYQVVEPQGKLVRVVEGSAFDVAVDLRRGSRNYLKWVGFELAADDRHLLWIPPGFAHGFLVTSDAAEFEYKCTAYYVPEHDRAIRWDDPNIGIDWPLGADVAPVLSERDANAPYLADAEVYE
jgi:dTDP-4-dehydrorhamnose 3,5-epimerase